MKEIEVTAKRWGNSIGVTIPKEVVLENNIKEGEKVKLLIPKQINTRKIFGTLKFKQSSQKIKDEMRKGWQPEH